VVQLKSLIDNWILIAQGLLASVGALGVSGRISCTRSWPSIRPACPGQEVDRPNRLRHHRWSKVAGTLTHALIASVPSDDSLSPPDASASGIVRGLRDPLGTILQLLTGVLSHSSRPLRADLNSELRSLPVHDARSDGVRHPGL